MFEKYEVANMKEDAYIAADALDAIRKELESTAYIGPRYLIEKATSVKNCMEYILRVCEEAQENERKENR